MTFLPPRARAAAFAACLLALTLTCGGGAPAGRASQTAASSSRVGDPLLTARARLLAGLVPDGGDFKAVTSLDTWRKWQQEFDLEWGEATTTRFGPMSEWSRRHLSAATGACDTLLYPFSGPDILNAVVLFPNCRRYVLFGLEHTGILPAIERLPADRVGLLIEETRHALGDLLTRNYAITRHMMRDMAAPELHGNFPILAIFLARLDAGIVSARDLEIAEDGSLRPAPKTPPPGHLTAPALEIVFERPGRPAQTVLYFRAQAEDRAIRQRPGVVPLLESLSPSATFLKSASYLMHGDQFRIVRGVLLRRSPAILQDDSGIPIRFLRPPDWTVTYFGRYQKPVKDFNYGYQPDLAQAYAREPVEPLTFSFGYHWETGSSAVMLAVRGARPAADR